jgi:ceramide glucosyltransferase
MGLRIIVGLTAGVLLLRDRNTKLYWWLMPFRDLWGFAVWVAGAIGNTVYWRGKRLRLDGEGRILSSNS